MTITTASAALSHVGRVRANNQDSGYAGSRLFVVADGMGGHAGGDVASAIAVNRVAEADRADVSSPQEAEVELHSALVSANRIISETVSEHPELTGMGTTVSALMRVGDTVTIAHIGDSRIYLLRDGELSQVTNDHTFVQRLVETGRISPEEAAVHPRRSVLMRVLGDIDRDPEIDTSILGTVPGDRWMLCSDGLSSYVSEERILTVLQQAPSADAASERLVQEALEHGAPDNVTTVVLDVDEDDVAPGPPTIVGSAAAPLAFETPAPDRTGNRVTGLLLHPLRGSHTPPEASFRPESEDYLDALIREDRRRRIQRRVVWLVAIALLVAGAVIGALVAYRYTQTRYYVGLEGSRVAVYQGVQPEIGPIGLSHVVERTALLADELPSGYRDRVRGTIPADDLRDARRIVSNLETLRSPDGG